MKSFVLVKQFAIVAAVALITTMLASCGSSNTTNPNSVTGNWTITLFNSNNVATYTITTTLSQRDSSPSISSPVTGSNLTLNTDASEPSGCFAADSAAAQNGVLTVSDNFNGQMVDTLQLTIQGSTGTIAMRGPFLVTGISGPWALTLQTPNSACSASGTFLMTRSQ